MIGWLYLILYCNYILRYHIFIIQMKGVILILWRIAFVIKDDETTFFLYH
jgi:hypothetical protein